jgi:TIR domain
MSVAPTQGIFISYRREDAAPYARLLHHELSTRFPEARVFMDLDSIEGGKDFADAIGEAVDSSTVLVALIGRQWATLADDEGRRLDNPDDFVRFEVRTALERGVRVIPVLVDGAKPPRRQELPSELHKLARLNAVELSYGRYQYDVDRLFDLIQRVLAEAPGTNTVRQPLPTADAKAPVVSETIRPEGGAPDEVVQKDAKPISSDRAIRVLAEAESITQYMTDESWRAPALAWIAKALAATDPPRAARLIADAEDSAELVTGDEFNPDSWVRAGTLAALVRTLAATNPDHAERIAQSIPNEHVKAEALADIAKALAATQPESAKRIAQAIITSITSLQRGDLDDPLKVLAAIDPDDAERVARSFVDETDKCRALVVVAGTLAATDPDRSARLITYAERIAWSVKYESPKMWALLGIVEALAPVDPDRAAQISVDVERFARSESDVSGQGDALSRIAEALAVIDPTRALRIARSIKDDVLTYKSSTLGHIAGALAATDPDRALRIARSKDVDSLDEKNEALAHIAGAVAATDPDRAERIAQSIRDDDDDDDKYWKSCALANVVAAVAATDPDRAERIAQSIPHEYWKVAALVTIAEA